MRPRICLNMIVRDEAPRIRRCLESLLPLTDGWVVCDTGSGDGTPDLIERFFGEAGLSGELHDIPFRDFSQARNAALDRCRASPLDFDYILLCDADMELRFDEPPEEVRRRLSAPAYLVLQRNGLSYYNLRLLRRDVRGRYVGPTHEVLRVEAPKERLAGAWFLDHASGSSRRDKLDRDLRLLERALREEPGNPRYLFYLAQTHYDAGEYARAAEVYRQRIEAGGWDEEVWYSRFRLALCHLKRSEPAAFIDACLQAYRDRPHRAEPLYELARALREAGDHENAMSVCEAGIEMPYPEGDLLFVDNRTYSWGFRHEMSIAGYYCRDAERREAGRRHCHALSVSDDVPVGVREAARRNVASYARPLGELLAGLSFRELEVPTEPGFHPMNPSVCTHEGELLAIVRTVNYSSDRAGRVIVKPEGRVRTRNLLVTLTGGLAAGEVLPVEDLAPGPPIVESRILGFEDCRLISLDGRLLASCTVRDRDPRERCEIALLGIEADGRVTAVHPERSYQAHLHQKNWMPLVQGGELRFVYSCDPTVILRWDFERHRAVEERRQSVPLALDHLRGGSQGLPVEDGWLFLVHEVALLPDGVRVYLHRFVRLDEELRLASLSEPFYFVEPGIEFCAGLERLPGKDLAVASFGLGDSRAYLATFSLAEAQALCGGV